MPIAVRQIEIDVFNIAHPVMSSAVLPGAAV